MKDEVITTTCASHCGGTCRLTVHVRDGVITRLETDTGDEPQLRACLKGRAYRQRVYAPDRLIYPLKRIGKRGEGKFQRISWAEALTTVAQKLKGVRDSYGPSSILLVALGGDLTQIHTLRPMHRLLCLNGGYTPAWGTPSFHAGMYASRTMYGTWFASNTRDDLLNSRLIIMWGWNPAVTICGTNTAWYLAQAKEKGAQIVAVDPRYTDSAAILADQWIPIRPGTDAAMLLAMAYLMVTEHLLDQTFLNKYTVGFDRFRDYVLGITDGQPKTPDWAQGITGVIARTIENLAREYAQTKPAALMAGIAPGRTAYGEQYHRAAITLAAMTGNIGIHGGDAAGRAWESIIGGYPFRMKTGHNLRPEDGINPVDTKLPHNSPRLLGYQPARVHFYDIADFILRGKAGGYHADCKLVYVVNSNWLNQTPDVNKNAQALKSERLEFIAVQEQFMTPTAKFADILLPTTTFLERNDIACGVGTAYYGFARKVIEPIGECKSHLEIARELAVHLGLANFGDETEEERLQRDVSNSEIPNYESFKEQGLYRIHLKEPHVAFKSQIEDPEHNPFPTPSGKVEIFSSQWAALKNPALPPIPKYIPSWEGRDDPLAAKYPLQLITTHFKRRALSQFDNIPWLRELGLQAVYINTIDAQRRGIENGDLVRIYNDRGQVITRAMVTERIMPGVVDLPFGAWFTPDREGVDWGGCANVLTKALCSPGGAFTTNTALVEIKRKA